MTTCFFIFIAQHPRSIRNHVLRFLFSDLSFSVFPFSFLFYVSLDRARVVFGWYSLTHCHWNVCIGGVAPVVIVFVVEFVGGWWQWRQWNTAAAAATGVNHDLHDTVGTVEAKMSNSPSVYCAAWCRSLIADSIYFTTIKRNTGKLWANRAWHINVVDNNNHWQFNWRISR